MYDLILQFSSGYNNKFIDISFNLSGELTALLILLVLKGLAAGSSFPAISVLLAAWVPEKERGFLGVFVLGANQVHK